MNDYKWQWIPGHAYRYAITDDDRVYTKGFNGKIYWLDVRDGKVELFIEGEMVAYTLKYLKWLCANPPKPRKFKANADGSMMDVILDGEAMPQLDFLANSEELVGKVLNYNSLHFLLYKHKGNVELNGHTIAVCRRGKHVRHIKTDTVYDTIDDAAKAGNVSCETITKHCKGKVRSPQWAWA